MNLSLHIAELLKTNDCVIIPDLGGFIANYQAAEYDPQVNQFSPPSKEIIFSSKLKKNDGLLVNYISEREGVKYLEAREIVSEFVAECMFKLENGERVDFDQIGVLYFDQNDHLLFDGGSNVNIRTDAFGLDSFHFPPLVNKYTQPQKPVFRDKDPEPQARRQPLEVVKYALLILPILAALYFIPKVISHDPANQLQTSNAASISLKDTPATKAAETTVLNKNSAVEGAPAANKTEESDQSQVTEEVVKSPEPATTDEHVTVAPVAVQPKVVQPVKNIALTSVSEPSKGKFHVVGGCFKIRENADKLANQLIQKGYPAQVASLGKSFYRVSVERFQTRKEAEQAMVKLLDADPNADYWLLVDKR